MYVTRPLSMYRESPSTLSMEPPDAPYSGYLVITDEEAEAQDSFCWGRCKRKEVKKLPFPQDKILTILHSSEYGETKATKVWLLPVLDKPLSTNRYYVIRAKGKYKGKACRCSRAEDVMACCFSDILMEKKPKPFDIRDLYQQFKIHTHQSGGFFAESITPDGIPPKLLRRKGWKVRSSTTFYDRLRLGEALGLDASLRALLPDFNFPIFRRRSASVAVGKWFCPFIFVREKARPKQQMKKSMFYTMTLEQKWEEIYSCGNVNSEDDVVIVDVDVQREVTFVAGKEAARDDRNGHNGFVWFKVHNPNSRGGELGVGLSSAIVENIRWVEEAGGWVNGAEREVRVERVEQITSESEWERFGCYVLVESFVLRRMDGGLVLKWDFRHTDRIQCKWECGF